MAERFGPGLHAAAGRPVDTTAYGQYVGRWSRLFIPSVLAAAGVSRGSRVLDVATGPGDGALAAAPAVAPTGFVVGADVSRAMLTAARDRLGNGFSAVATDGQALAFRSSTFDAVVCQLGLQFFPNPMLGLTEFRRVLRRGGRTAVCVVSTPDRAPMWGVLADAVSRHLPDQRETLHLSFALSDAGRLKHLLDGAGLRNIRVERETREGVIERFADYWAPIEAGTGLIPQAYLSLSESARHAVRDEVRARLAHFESGGRLVMKIEMLIGSAVA